MKAIAPRRPRRPRSTTSEFYIDTKQFHTEILDYYTTPEGDAPSESLGLKVITLARKLGSSHKFQGYHFREEMESEAIGKMLQALLRRKYDPKFAHPFAYFTRIAMNAFVGRINKEKTESEGLKRFQDFMYRGQEDSDSGWENVRRARHSTDEEFFNHD